MANIVLHRIVYTILYRIRLKLAKIMVRTEVITFEQ